VIIIIHEIRVKAAVKVTFHRIIIIFNDTISTKNFFKSIFTF